MDKATCTRRLVVLSFLALGASSLSPAAFSDSVTPAFVSGSLDYPVTGVALTQPGTVSLANSTGSYIVSMNYMGGVASASTTATQTAGGPPDSTEGAVGYYFEVVAPTSTTAVLDLSSTASTSTTGNATVESRAGLATSSTYLTDVCSGSGIYAANCTLGSSFKGSVQFTVPTNTMEEIFIQVAGSGSNGSWNGSMEASIAFDAADKSGGALTVSADLPVPLPSTLPLLSFGLASVGLLVGRRRALPGRLPHN